MVKDAPFIRTSLALTAGPIIWALHFLVIYIVTALSCARHFYDMEWFGVGVVQLAIAAATVSSIAAIALILRAVHRAFGRLSQESKHFALSMAVALSLLSILAILWDALPALIVPVCG
jgi:hypothetical protein